jgi:hypothetical protein
VDSTGIKVEGEGEWHARKHGGPKRRVWRKIHLGIDEETLEIRVVEVTGSHIGDAPVLPNLLSQIPAGEEIGSVTAPSRQIASQSPAGQWTAPMIGVSAMMRSLTAAPTPSYRPARTRRRGRPSPLVLSPETRPCGRRNISAVRSGETGADTTDEAVQKRNLSGSCFA